MTGLYNLIPELASNQSFLLDDSDETITLQSWINAHCPSGTGSGGWLMIDAYTTLGVFGQITFPVNGSGNSCPFRFSGPLIGFKSLATIDLRYAGSRIVEHLSPTGGWTNTNVLMMDGLNIVNNGTACGVMIDTTYVLPYVLHNNFTAADQGSPTANCEDLVNATGWAGDISNNVMNRGRHLVVLGSAGSSTEYEVQSNYVNARSGSSVSGDAPIVLLAGNSHTLYGNEIEMTNYSCGISLSAAMSNQLLANAFHDGTSVPGSFDYCADSASIQNIVLLSNVGSALTAFNATWPLNNTILGPAGSVLPGGTTLWNGLQALNRSNLSIVVEPVPAASTASQLSTSTGNCTAGPHTVAVTFITTQGETTTSPGSASVVCDSLHTMISVTGIPVGSSAVSGRNVYMTTAGGTVYYLAGISPMIANNTTTSFTLNVADSSLLVLSPLFNTTGGQMTGSFNVAVNGSLPIVLSVMTFGSGSLYNQIRIGRSGGTISAPTAVPANTRLGKYSLFGFDGATLSGSAGYFSCITVNMWQTTDHSADCFVGTTDVGSVAVRDTFLFGHDGNFGFIRSTGQHIVMQASQSDTSGTCVFSATTCTVFFTKAYNVAPACTATDETAPAPIKAVPSGGSVILTGGIGAGLTDTVAYHCIGNPN
jgi:hypothetical protein